MQTSKHDAANRLKANDTQTTGTYSGVKETLTPTGLCVPLWPQAPAAFLQPCWRALEGILEPENHHHQAAIQDFWATHTLMQMGGACRKQAGEYIIE